MRIYIASPYSKGDRLLNIRRAIEAGDKLFEMGHLPYIPHLLPFWHYVSPKSENTWMEMGRQWLECCDAVLRLDGESQGADLEVEYAKKLGKKVYYSLHQVWARDVARA